MECDIDTVRVIQVMLELFYRYLAKPHIYKAYLKHKVRTNSRWSACEVFCNDPRINSFATLAYCVSQSDKHSSIRLNKFYYREHTFFETVVAIGLR